jgi:predicted transcriptional regulator
MVGTPEVGKVLGPLEAEVMQVLWASDAALSVRAVLDELNRDRSSALAYTTVMTVLVRLAEKGIVLRERNGRGFDYQPTLPDAAAIAVRNVVRDFGEAAVAGFVDEARADPALLRRLRKLLNEPS